MNLTKLLVAGAAALTLNGVAFANPIFTSGNLLVPYAPVTVDPANLLASRTGFASQEVCPDPSAANNCLASSPFTQPGNNVFTINVLSIGTLDATMIPSLAGSNPPFTYLDSFLTWTLRDAGNNIVGQGSISNGVSTFIDDVQVSVGAYTMEVLYKYNGLDNLGSAQWSMAITTAVRRQVPEPGTLALMGLALAGIGLLRRRS